MIASTAALNSVFIHFAVAAIFITTALMLFFWLQFSNEKFNRRIEKEMHRRRLVQLENCVAFFQERERLAEEVRRQQTDEPAVTLPVTNCERRERRRRFLPLEGDNNATG